MQYKARALYYTIYFPYRLFSPIILYQICVFDYITYYILGAAKVFFWIHLPNLYSYKYISITLSKKFTGKIQWKRESQFYSLSLSLAFSTAVTDVSGSRQNLSFQTRRTRENTNKSGIAD